MKKSIKISKSRKIDQNFPIPKKYFPDPKKNRSRKNIFSTRFFFESRKNIFSTQNFFDLEKIFSRPIFFDLEKKISISKKNSDSFSRFEIFEIWNFGSPLFENFEIFEISNQDKKNSTHSNLSRFFLWPRMVMKFQKSIGFTYDNFLQVFQKNCWTCPDSWFRRP